MDRPSKILHRHQIVMYLGVIAKKVYSNVSSDVFSRKLSLIQCILCKVKFNTIYLEHSVIFLAKESYKINAETFRGLTLFL